MAYLSSKKGIGFLAWAVKIQFLEKQTMFSWKLHKSDFVRNNVFKKPALSVWLKYAFIWLPVVFHMQVTSG